MKGGQFKSSECQVLMCLFSITAVPGSDREGKTNGNADVLHTDAQLWSSRNKSTAKRVFVAELLRVESPLGVRPALLYSPTGQKQPTKLSVPRVGGSSSSHKPRCWLQ